MRKFLAVLLVLFFSFIFPLSIICLCAEQTLLKAEYYKTEFAKQHIYQLVLDSFNAGFQQKESTDLKSSVEWWSIEQLVNTGFSANWLKTNTEQVLDGFFGLLEPNGKITDLGDDVLNFAEPRTQLTEFVKANTEKNINNLPECTSEQVQSILTTNTKITDLKCLPSDFSDIRNKAPEEITKGLLSVFPERINALAVITFFIDLGKQKASENTEDLYQQLSQNPDIANYPELAEWQSGLEQIHLWLAAIHYTLWGGILASILCLILIMVLFWRSWRIILHWWSFCWLWAGLNGLGLVVPLKIFLLQKQFLEPLISSFFNIPAPLTAISNLIFQIIQGICSGFINLIFWYMGGSLVIGIIILVISFLIKKTVNYAGQNSTQDPLAQSK